MDVRDGHHLGSRLVEGCTEWPFDVEKSTENFCSRKPPLVNQFNLPTLLYEIVDQVGEDTHRLLVGFQQ